MNKTLMEQLRELPSDLRYADKKSINIKNLSLTNADKIRSMSDEELAEFISEKIEHGLCFYTGSISDTHGFDKINDSKIHLSWLQSEVEE